jgi:hypothetical protein
LVTTEVAAVTPEGRISPEDLGIWSEQEALLLEGLDHGTRPSGAPEGIEKEPDGSPRLLVRAENRLALGIVEKADRQGMLELAPPSFVQDPALEPGPQYVRFGFAHGPL